MKPPNLSHRLGGPSAGIATAWRLTVRRSASRSLFIDGNSELKIVVSKDLQIYPQVSCDGQNHFTCAPGDTITVSKKPQKLRLIHPLDHNYYEVCRTKLGWGSRLGSSDD